MYKNISKILLAVVSLAMMAAARTVKVTEDQLRAMNETADFFKMSTTETFTLKMDYPKGGEHWNLRTWSTAPYLATGKSKCFSDHCTVSWDITYNES